MRLIISLLLVVVVVGRVDNVSLCKSGHCVCRVNNKSEKEDYGEIVDCSYYARVLEENYELPSSASSLDLSRNNITTVRPTLVLRSNSLAELLLHDNSIHRIEIGALQLPALKKLDLSNNHLTFIAKETFKQIKGLEYLNLAHNDFHALSALSFHHLADLSEIILDDNHLGPSLRDRNLFDRNGYGLTHKIRSLSIRGIDLNTVPDNFFVDAYDVRKLIASDNNISEIFELPITLEYLDLSDNPIDDLSGEDFASVPGLRELKLNNLSIAEIPDYAFASLPGVAAPGEKQEPARLQRGSRLSTLSERLRLPLGQLVFLDLQGNLWNCDCRLIWIKQLQIDDGSSEHFRCFTPKPLFNGKITEIHNKYFVCPVERHLTGAVIGAVSACVLLTFIAAWIYVMVPKRHSKFNFIKNMHATTGYSLLPVHMPLSGGP
ncbi:unnamed protein product [Leptosia nina]|uniref:Uncharacterized protein n=1 Tax=Leptosia nina TaxID=320188 RepID=A0AAV1J0J9_9NEOP